MAEVTYSQLNEIVKNYIDSTKVAQGGEFVPTQDNTANLLDKIGLLTFKDSLYVDKLAFMDGESLDYGKTVEEYYIDLIAPIDKDTEGTGVLAKHKPTFEEAAYSYTLKEKQFDTTEEYNDYRRAVNNEEQYISMITSITKRLEDSSIAFKYTCKRELLGKYAAAAEAEQGATDVFAANTAYAKYKCLKESNASDVRGIVRTAIESSNTETWAQLVADGHIVVLNMVSVMSAPTDETTGEAFIEQLKKDVEKANDMSEGYSLNGNALGVSPAGLRLVMKQGIQPVLDTKVMAGAFHTDKVALPAEVDVIKDFGADTTGVFAILMDFRGARLHLNYQDVLTNLNGSGSFLNFFKHVQYTAYWSKNTFIKVYRAA